jgi:lipopolysaccharide/colanic/teichoic acid biosynthesis glycosyltransferase
VNQQVFYIGANDQLAQHFSKVLLDLQQVKLKIFKNNRDAVNWLNTHKDTKELIVLYERKSLKTDISDINLLRTKFPKIHILLVTDDLPDSDRMFYIKSGVNDTVSSSVGIEEFNAFFQFFRKFNRQTTSNKQQNLSELGSFKIPIFKRLFDIVVSFFALLFLSPLFLLVAFAIRVESKGPIFYKSKRVGSNYHIFDFWKFRSMYVDADKRLKEMEKYNQYATSTPVIEKDSILSTDLNLINLDLDSEGLLVDDDFIIPEVDFVSQIKQKKDNAFVKFEKDPRVTKVGQFIRKYSIDELPQLINILKGDMSIVGNRPLPLYEAELLTQDNSVERFIAPAGLTGLWQVLKRGDSGKLSAEERKQLDIYYAQHYSIWLDIKIIFSTFTAFIQKEDV